MYKKVFYITKTVVTIIQEFSKYLRLNAMIKFIQKVFCDKIQVSTYYFFLSVNMTRHLLFALALLLVLELTTTYRIENSHEKSHKRFHAHEEKKKEQIKTLDDIDSLMAKMHKRGAVSRQISKAVKDNYGFSVPEGDDDELDESDNKATISAYEEQLRDMHEDNIHEDPSSVAELKAIAKSLVAECKVNVTRPKEEKLSSALKPLYQLLQHHGPEGIITDEEFSEAKASELCAACVLRNLCERDDVLNLTNVPGGLSP